MQEKTITITIDEQGDSTLDLNGFLGRECEKAFEDFRGGDTVKLGSASNAANKVGTPQKIVGSRSRITRATTAGVTRSLTRIWPASAAELTTCTAVTLGEIDRAKCSAITAGRSRRLIGTMTVDTG